MGPCTHDLLERCRCTGACCWRTTKALCPLGALLLVYYAMHPTMEVAIRREKQLKEWRWLWKIRERCNIHRAHAFGASGKMTHCQRADAHRWETQSDPSVSAARLIRSNSAMRWNIAMVFEA